MENICTVRQFRRKAKQVTRCGASTAQPVKKRTARINRNGFLTHAFRPFWAFDSNKARAEKEFFRSLANICAYYDLLIPDVTGLTFPQNIYRSWEITAERINAIDKKLDCIILKDEKHIATLATIRQFDTGATMYYIPVRPLWNWSNKAQQQPIAELVSAIFAYLVQVVKMPFYTEMDSYLGQQYGYIEQMILDETEDCEEDKEYRQVQTDELYTLQNAGLHIYRAITTPELLTRMEEIVSGYAHNEVRDNDWAILAIEFYQLYQNYPERSVFDHIRPDLFYPEIEERISADEYLGFYWSGNDDLVDIVVDMINCSFQEMQVTDEPITVELFDTLTEKKNENFGFETRLFALIKRLCELLNDYDYAECK
jgi:hypothetical protein